MNKFKHHHSNQLLLPLLCKSPQSKGWSSHERLRSQSKTNSFKCFDSMNFGLLLSFPFAGCSTEAQRGEHLAGERGCHCAACASSIRGPGFSLSCSAPSQASCSCASWAGNTWCPVTQETHLDGVPSSQLAPGPALTVTGISGKTQQLDGLSLSLLKRNF